jgi:hypothetical protein
MPTLSTFNKCLIFKNLGQGLEKKATYSRPLLDSMINNLGKLSSLDFDSNELIPLLKFIPYFVQNNIEYESKFVSFFSTLTKSSILSLSPENQENLELILSRIGEYNKYFDVKLENSESIYSVLSKLVENRVDSMSISQVFSSLRCLVTNDRGDEDLMRRLELKLIHNLSALHEKNLAVLLNIYSRRIIFNIDYMMNSIYEPIYEEILNRFEFLTGKTLSYMLFNYWRNSSIHGMYCDERIKEKIQKKCENLEFFKMLGNETREYLMINFISYLSHARQMDSDIIEKVLKFEEEFERELSPMFYLRALNFLTRARELPPKLLKKFTEHFPFYLKNSENFISLYIVWMNVKYLNPQKVSDLQHVFTENVLQELSQFRKEKFSKLNKTESFIHSEITKALDQNKIKHINEYFEEFFFDIALPNEKICLEVTGPGHYLYPSLKLNGKSQNRKEIIENLGWKYHTYSYLDYSKSTKSIHQLISKLIPLHIS